MDSHLRQILRDPNSDAELCYHHLVRAGFFDFAINQELIRAGKLEDSLGVYETFKVELKVMSLPDAREVVANFAFDEYEFGDPVVAVDGWEYMGRNERMTRRVYVDPRYDEEGAELDDNDHNSIRVDFEITFEDNSAVPERYGAY